MTGRSHSLLVLAALAAGVALTGCGRNETPPPAPAPAPAAAASAPAPAPAGPIIAPAAPVVATDAQRQSGATLAAQGGGGSVPACNSCHGANGEGMAATGFPRLAGQSFTYLSHELASYADGSRKHPVMQPIAAAMTPDQRVAAAAYFSGLNPDGTPSASTAAGAGTPASGTATASAATASGAGAAASGASGSASAAATAAAPTEMASASRTTASASTRTAAASAARAPGSGAASAAAAGGKSPQLVSLGDNARGIQGCVNCHGPGGVGSGELYPYLAGQHASYLAATLGAWADGSRNNDPSGQMPIIAKALTPDEMKSLAAYYAAQPPRNLPIGSERLASVGFTPAPAVTSGPQAATPAAGTAGTGPDQGAATSGAQSQFPGGSGAAATGQPLPGGAAATGAASASPAAASAAQRGASR